MNSIIKKDLVGHLLLIAITLTVGTTLFWLSEKGINTNVDDFFDVIWWWVISTTTIGYGDIVPVTVVGRLVGIFTVIQGIYLYTNFITIASSVIHSKLNAKKLGTRGYKLKSHIVICEYTALADELIENMDTFPELKGKDVVIVSDLIKMNPYTDKYFVKGTPYSPDALRSASIETASDVFIFVNSRFSNPDIKTYHLASRIRRVSPKSKLYLELVNKDNKILKKIGGEIQTIDSEKALKQLLEEGRFEIG